MVAVRFNAERPIEAVRAGEADRSCGPLRSEPVRKKRSAPQSLRGETRCVAAAAGGADAAAGGADAAARGADAAARGADAAAGGERKPPGDAIALFGGDVVLDSTQDDV